MFEKDLCKKKSTRFLLWIIEKNDIKSFAIIDATFNFTSLLELLFFLCRSIVDECKNLTNRDRGDGNVFLFNHPWPEIQGMWDTHVYTISFLSFPLILNSFLKHIFTNHSTGIWEVSFELHGWKGTAEPRMETGTVENGKRAQQLATQKYLIKITTVVTRSAAASITKENTRK